MGLIALKIGARVCFQGNKKIAGTIDEFVLSEGSVYPPHNGILAHVNWDKGTDDWYNGTDLKLLNDEK